MYVKWKDDLRLNPDNLPEAYREDAWSDMSRIFDRQGHVVKTNKSFWSGWTFLVLCDDGKFREVDVDKATVIPDPRQKRKAAK